MTDSSVDPADAAPPDDLAEAFRLPDEILADEGLVALHGNIVQRLRREASGMPMNTVQNLLLERIAFNYIVLKQKERTGGFTSPTQQKDFNTFWLSTTQEFNRLLLANDDKMREALLLEIQGIVVGAMDKITNPDERRDLRRYLQEQFAAIEV